MEKERTITEKGITVLSLVFYKNNFRNKTGSSRKQQVDRHALYCYEITNVQTLGKKCGLPVQIKFY